MSERGQTEAAPARAVESPRPVEQQPAVEVAAVAAEKLQVDVYKGTGSDGSRVNFNQSVIAASFAPGSPDAVREAGYMGGDFNSYRAMMDNMWLGSKKMPGVEREARFAGIGMLPMPDDKGLQCQTAGPNGAECTYKSSERKDGLAKLVRSRTDGREDVAKEYQGRKDHLIGEKYSAGKDLRSFERTFETGKGPNGLSTEKYLRTPITESFSRNFDPGQNKDKLQSEQVAKENGAVTIHKTFKDRADGVVHETTELTGNGAISMREMADGKKQLKVLTPDQLKARGIDVSGLSTAGDAATRVKKALDLGGSQDRHVATDLKNSKALKDAVQYVLKGTVGEKGLNDPSFDGANSPSKRDKAVIAIGASTGYEGLKEAGMIVDEKTNSATTTNGAKYTFEKQRDGKLRAVSVESEKSNRKFEFQYTEDGAFKGSIETTKVTDQPGSAEKPGSMKYQNMELPSLQKGWGPYQALQEMQRQGKIQMSQQEMQQEAVRIRNREFARLGRNHFKVGDTLQMYSPEEIKQEQGPRETAPGVRRDVESGVQRTSARGTRRSAEQDGIPSATSEYDEGGRAKRGDSTPHKRGRGKPGPDGTVAQRYINQESIDPEMRAVRAPQAGRDGSLMLRGSPSISAEKIDQILRDAKSPAAKERIRDQETGRELTFGQHLYKLGVEYGIDPALTLGFFKSESGFGKHGAAHRNNSVGNIKGDGGYRQYGSFTEGARDWFKLMQDGTHFLKAGRDTVAKVIPKYAPGKDGNDEGKYIRDVDRDVRGWSRASAHAPARESERSPERTPERTPDKTPERIAQITERERERKVSERYPLQRQNDAGRPIVEVRQGESIQAAIDKAQEGSIIKVHPGVYKERLQIKKDSISLRGDGQAIIDLDGQRTSGSAIDITNRRNVQIDGFEIRNVRGGDTPTGIKVEGTSRDISITNNNIHHIENSKNAHGIVVRGTSAEPMRNIIIAGNQVHHNKLGSSETIAINGNVDGFRVINNKVHDNDNIGIDVIGYEGVGRAGIDRARNGIIAGNTVFNIDTKSNPAYKGDRSGAGIYVDGGSDVIIEGNHIKNSNYGIELASEHRGKLTSRIQVRGNVVEGSHLAGISLGGGSPTNGGVNDSIIENNDFRNNSRPLWRQHNVGSDIVYRNNDGVIGQPGQPVKQPLELPQIRKTEKPAENDLVPQRSVRNTPTGRVVRDISDRSRFYAHQDDGHSCSAFSMAMMVSDHLKGRPPQYGQEMRGFKALAGTLSHGYRGSLDTMAGQLRQAGLEAKAYQYNRFGQKGMEDLNAELDQGHSAVARVINPHTGNRHYIYVAGRNADGNYILGDPDRGNPSHAQPVSPQRLMKMMSGRDGFVAGWAPSDSAAANIPGTAAYRRWKGIR